MLIFRNSMNVNMAAKLSNNRQYRRGYNGKKFDSLSYVIPRAPVSKSEGDLKSKRGRGSIPEWQNRPWSVTSQQNVLDFLSVSTENRDLETTMHRHYPRTNTPLDFTRCMTSLMRSRGFVALVAETPDPWRPLEDDRTCTLEVVWIFLSVGDKKLITTKLWRLMTSPEDKKNVRVSLCTSM